MIGRREFITLLGGAATAWPLAAKAQQARMQVLGFLGSAAEADYNTTTAAVRRGLNEAGYVEKQNLLIEYRGQISNTRDCLPSRPNSPIFRSM
jgi:putative tryptophan/tyrosine transport system substrate-binding protein